MDEIIQTMSNSFFGYGPIVGAESGHVDAETVAQGMSSETARVLIVAEMCFVLVHSATYIFSLRLWNAGNIFYILIFIAEELPNLFNLIITFAAVAD